MDHLVVGVVLYRGLLHRDSTLHLYSNQVLGMKWRFGLLLAALEEGKVSQDQQRHMNVRNRKYSQFNLIQILTCIMPTRALGHGMVQSSTNHTDKDMVYKRNKSQCHRLEQKEKRIY